MPKFSIPEAQTVGFMVALIAVIGMEAWALVVSGTTPSVLPMVLMLAAGLFYPKSGGTNGTSGGSNA